MTWSAEQEALKVDELYHYTLRSDEHSLSHADVYRLWFESETFREFYCDLLADSVLEAYFWECAPVTMGTQDKPFEFVLNNAPALAGIQAEPGAFRAYFTTDEVVAFENPGRDACLVAPCPLGDEVNYAHLAAFVRGAPRRQRLALWQKTGAAMLDLVGHERRWLSTSGLGVYWLHLRIDRYPKYYTYAPYR